MGKRLLSQKKGTGRPAYRRPSHRFKAKIEYRKYDDIEKNGKIKGQIIGFVDNPMHNAILMKILWENGDTSYLPCAEGLAVGDHIWEGNKADIGIGTITQLKNIPDGFYVYNIERIPGGGGKFVRSPGGYAIVMAKEGGNVILKFPSKRKIAINGNCRAQIGVIAGGGKNEKPLFTAGAAYHKSKAINSRWPRVRGVAMNTVAHPHGGKQHHAGKPTSVARNAPPGQKVGHIASKRTGRKKRK